MIKDKNIRKLTKISKNSIGLTLPIEMVRALRWRERQRVKVTRVKRGVLIRDWRRK